MNDTTHSIIRLTLIGAALAASLASAGARAEAQQVQHIIATTGTDGGGEILMTSVTCGNGREVLWLAPGGQVTHRGCASPLLPDRLYISSDSGHTWVVPRDSFVTAATTAPRAPHAEPAVFTVEELQAHVRRRLAEQAAARRLP